MFFPLFDSIISITSLLVCLTGLLVNFLIGCVRDRKQNDSTVHSSSVSSLSTQTHDGRCCHLGAPTHGGHRINFSTTSNDPLQPPAHRRRELPHEQIEGGGISWLDLARRTLPIHIFEPLSLLQAISEELRFAGQFLNQLNDQKDPTERFCSVIGFVLSGYSGLSGRSRKPFNPLLGETFDFISDDKWKYHAEQVSHHPPISACHADGPGWNWYQTFKSRVQNAMDSTSITSELPTRLLMSNGDEYSWNKVTTVIQNPRATAENRRIRNEGEMTISSNTGLEARIQFLADDHNLLDGTLQRLSDGVVLFHLKGHWHRGISRSTDGIKWKTIFEAPETNENAARFYGFSEFTMDLNCIHESQRPFLPSTDSRLRLDQRHLENGDVKRAEREKKRLEQLQRKRANLQHSTLWFERSNDSFTDQHSCHYWESKSTFFQDEHSNGMLSLFS
ncbi:Oxysterol-binding protein-related protein 3 [Aphelenchoides besseyi]|nr:Oxysterol-binding protein-related protein 3 [Aphelenchoides besseyi]